MRPLGARYGSSRTHQLCAQAQACPICAQCLAFDRETVQCRQCYPTILRGQRVRCYCGERRTAVADSSGHQHSGTMAEVAATVNQILDTPMYDYTKPNGTVNLTPSDPGNPGLLGGAEAGEVLGD